MTDTDEDVGSAAVSAAEAQSLLHAARASIQHGIEHREVPSTSGIAEYSPALSTLGASFVTLELHGSLRGCIGSIEAQRPLIDDVIHNAFAAAFRDPRFPPVSADELADHEIHVSILEPAEPLEVKDERDLLQTLKPGIDGLILEDPPYRSVFLPQVWNSLRDPREFLAHLKLKAGLPSDHWSPEIRFSRFLVREIAE